MRGLRDMIQESVGVRGLGAIVEGPVVPGSGKV